jgi:hypothetical protein
MLKIEGDDLSGHSANCQEDSFDWNSKLGRKRISRKSKRAEIAALSEK